MCSSKSPRSATAILAAAAAAAGIIMAAGSVAPLRANIPYTVGDTTPSGGFENGTTGWSSSTTPSGGSISTLATRYTYGSSNIPFGNLSAASGAYGTHYAGITNDTSNDTSGYTEFGGYTTYPGSSFTQSVSVYAFLGGGTSYAVWNPPAAPSNPAFEIQETAANSGGTSYNPATDANFQFYVSNPGSGNVLNVDVSGGDVSNAPLLTNITQTGWYTFKVAYVSNGGTAPAGIAFAAYNSATGQQLGLAGGLLTSVQSQDLGGNGYLWSNDWQSGFAASSGAGGADSLAIDNVAAAEGSVPEPATLSLLALGGLGLLARRRRRRTEGHGDAVTR